MALEKNKDSSQARATERKSNKAGDKASIKECDQGNRTQMKRSCLESQSKYMDK